MRETQDKADKGRTDPGGGPALDISDLSVSHDGKPVFEHLSLRLESGEIFGLVGVNGAGKTSLMKAIVNLLSPDAGQIRIYGVPNHLPESRRSIAYLPETFRPPPNLTGAQFLRLALGFHNIEYDLRAASELAVAAGLDPAALNARIASLSKGNGQKIGLLSGFLTSCPLLMLDEPMEGLDPHARILLKALLRGYRAQGKSVFMSSHILTDMEELCDRIAVLHGGRLVFTGPPSGLLRQYGAPDFEMAFLAAITPDDRQ